MSTREELQGQIEDAKSALAKAQAEFDAFESLAENNRYVSLDAATGSLEDILRDRAFNDCEGAGNCGMPEYTQEFMVDGIKYRGKLVCEYNRHDKTYYYIDESEFSYEAI